jgi:probable FeS assembly SUF system protein SufT
MTPSAPVTLKRDVVGTEIPAGNTTILPVGSSVMITQTLGGNFTVMDARGYLVRIAAKDADALGQEVAPAEARPEVTPGQFDEKLVWDQLRSVYDPEIPVNIVELGLVYKCEIVDDTQGGKDINVDMTMTAPGCGMGDVLKVDVQNKLEALPGVRSVNVQVVFDPPWDPSKMSEAARLELGMM